MPGPVLRHEPTAAVLGRWAAPTAPISDRRSDPTPYPISVLTPVERDRAAALRHPDDFVAAHLLAREVVGALLGCDPATVVLRQTCPTCGGPHGRPSVAGAHVSWSHTRGYVAAVASPAAVGIDVELLADRSPVGDRLLARVATPAEAAAIAADPHPEAAFLRMWVAKESLVKVGVIDLDAFGRTDVSAGVVDGFALTTSAVDGIVLGLAQPAESAAT